MNKNILLQSDVFKKTVEPNILYFAPCGLHEGVGGAARLKNMVDTLEQQGAIIQLISYVPKDKFKVEYIEVRNCLSTTIVYVRKHFPKFLKIFALLPLFIYGLRHIKKIDIIFAHAPSIVTGFPALLLAKIFNKPLIIDHMDIKDPATPKIIYDIVLRNSNTVFAISRYLEKEAKRIGCRNVLYVPIFINADFFQKNDLERSKIRTKLGLDNKDIVVGYTGSFWYVEGLPFLLKAFKNLSIKYQNIKLVIVGGRNVPMSDNVSGLVDQLELKEKVILVPPQPYESMPGYMSAFDIACSPKIDCAENRAANPIKIYEYMSMGLLTVASKVGEISNIIENEHDGFLVKPEDETSLERILEYIIKNKNSLEHIKENSRGKIIRNYTQQAVCIKIQNIFN